MISKLEAKSAQLKKQTVFKDLKKRTKNQTFEEVIESNETEEGLLSIGIQRLQNMENKTKEKLSAQNEICQNFNRFNNLIGRIEAYLDAKNDVGDVLKSSVEIATVLQRCEYTDA